MGLALSSGQASTASGRGAGVGPGEMRLLMAIIVGLLACGVLSTPSHPSMGSASLNIWANKAAGVLPDDLAYPNAYFETYNHEKGQPVYTKPHITEVDGADPVHETADDVTKENRFF